MPPRHPVTTTLDFCLRVGEVLLSSGAGAADVAYTMNALAWQLGLHPVEVDVTFTSLRMSYQGHAEDPPTIMVRGVKERDLDYQDLTQVDQLVRYVLTGQMDLSEARVRLGRITSSGHHTPRWAVSLGWGVMCAASAVQLGGDLVVVGVALVAAVVIDRLRLRLHRTSVFYQQIAGGLVATLLGVVTYSLQEHADVSALVSANIIMLLAGIGFMGALHDALTGYYITAGARLLEAILATSGIIAGVTAGLSVARVLGIGVISLDPGRLPASDTSIETLVATIGGAALSAGAFAFASYAPRRSLIPIVVIAGVAMLIRYAMIDEGFDRPWASGVAAFVVGLVCFWASRKAGVPPLVLVVSGVVPMLPGLTIYRGLTLLTEGGSFASVGILELMTAASTALALSAGVLAGEYVAQPIKEQAKRLPKRFAGPRLVGMFYERAPRRRRSG